MEITKDLAAKVLCVVDAGLSGGLGKPIPGQMCVEAAVCYALGQEHGDKPSCVDEVLRDFKISLNDKEWSSNIARASGLRRIAIAQLGTKDNFNSKEFVDKLSLLTIRSIVPKALRVAASVHHDETQKVLLEDVANLCETNPTQESVNKAVNIAYSAASASAYASDAASAASYSTAYSAAASAYSAASYSADAASASKEEKAKIRDKVLADFAEDVVQILIEMKTPGSEFVDLLAPLEV